MNIVNAILTALENLFTIGLVSVVTQLVPSLRTLFGFLAAMPLDMTTGNTVVMKTWTTMAIIADAFLGLFVLIGTIQIMYSDVSGGLRMPLPQFLGKAVLTGVLIQLSPFIATQLLTLNNDLSAVVGVAIKNTFNGLLTQLTAAGTTGGVASVILAIIVVISIFRLIFQAVSRVLRFNLLFVLSGPAILLSHLPATESVFEGWMRLFFATAFEQFVQFLALALVLAFLASAAQANLAGLLLSIAAFNLAAEVPTLLARLIGGGSSRGGAGALGTVAKAALLVKFFV